MYSQSNNIAVENIYRKLGKPVNFIELSDSTNIIEGKYIKGDHKTEFLLLEILKSVNLKFKTFTYNNPSPPYYRDSIFLFKKKYCIDNLLYEKKILKNELPLRLNYASGYKFVFNSRKYISLFFWDSEIPTTNLTYFIILFDISNKENVKTYFFGEQKSFNSACFGDFNNDGILDFTDWTRRDTLKLMSLSGNQFKLIKNKYIVLEEKSYSMYSINWKKSKWF